MNRRVLYIVIVIAVLVLGGVLILPRVLGGGGATAGAKPAVTATAARGKKAVTKDTSAAAARSTGGKRAKVKSGKAAAAAEPAAQPGAPVAAPEVRDTTPLQWGNDPFVRDWIMAGELRDLKLRAVTLGAKSLALINDRIVAKGDTINGKRVAEITRDSVVVEFGGQRRGLKIGE